MDSEYLKSKELRLKAEKISQDRSYPIEDLSKDELIEELRIHQIELELQNDELKDSQIKLEDSQNKYFELYNLAPVGYFTLDENGLILDVNIAGAALLGTERKNLINKAFVRCIIKDYRNDFYHAVNDDLESGMKKVIELQLQKLNNKPFYAYLEIINIPDTNGDLLESRITVTNIDELKNKEKELKDYQDTLEAKVKERTFELKKKSSIVRYFI